MTLDTHISSSLLFILDGQEFVTDVSTNSNREIDYKQQSKLTVTDNSHNGIDVRDPINDLNFSTFPEAQVEEKPVGVAADTRQEAHTTGTISFQVGLVEMKMDEEDVLMALLQLSGGEVGNLSGVGGLQSMNARKRKQVKAKEILNMSYP